MRSWLALTLLLLVTVVGAFGFAPTTLYASTASKFSGKSVSRRTSLTYSVKSRTPAGNFANSKMVIY
jgi:hypothetical protein